MTPYSVGPVDVDSYSFGPSQRCCHRCPRNGVSDSQESNYLLVKLRELLPRRMEINRQVSPGFWDPLMDAVPDPLGTLETFYRRLPRGCIVGVMASGSLLFMVTFKREGFNIWLLFIIFFLFSVTVDDETEPLEPLVPENRGSSFVEVMDPEVPAFLPYRL